MFVINFFKFIIILAKFHFEYLSIMPKSVIPKAENTSEVIEASLLKNTFISKRNALHRNTIPLKYRNNLK